MHRLYFLLASFINTVVPAGALAQPCTGSQRVVAPSRHLRAESLRLPFSQLRVGLTLPYESQRGLSSHQAWTKGHIRNKPGAHSHAKK